MAVSRESCIWIGLAHVRPVRSGHILPADAGGGYVHVALRVKSREAFLVRLQQVFADYGLQLIELDDLDTEEAYRAQGRMGADMEAMLADLDATEIGFSSFDTYRVLDG